MAYISVLGFIGDIGIIFWGISSGRDYCCSIHKYSSIGDISSSTPSSYRSWPDCGRFSSCFVTLETILLWSVISFSRISSLLLCLFSLSIFCKSNAPLWVTVHSISFLGQILFVGDGISSVQLESFYSTVTHVHLPYHSLPDTLLSLNSSIYLFRKYSHSLSAINFSHSFCFFTQLVFDGSSMSDGWGLTMWPTPLSIINFNKRVGSKQRNFSLKSI